MKKIEYSYSSELAEHLKEYEEYYLMQNKRRKSVELYLRRFDQYLVSVNYVYGEPITEEIVAGYLSTWDGLAPRTVYAAVSSLTRLFRYLRINYGISCYYPPKRKADKSRYVPYIFAEEDISKFFSYCDMWREKVVSVNSHALVMPSLSRLLYSTAIRISEAVEIRNKDVNLKKHYILIKGGKNKKDRLAPINPSMEEVLRDYIKRRNRLPLEGITNPENPFFVTVSGGPCNPGTILLRFQAIVKLMGINYFNGKHGVRVHDIRHTACVHALMKMIKSGKDPYCCLPILSVFMGHSSPESTEYYLRLTKDAFPDLNKQSRDYTNAINKVIRTAVEEGYENK